MIACKRRSKLETYICTVSVCVETVGVWILYVLLLEYSVVTPYSASVHSTYIIISINYG